MMEQPINVVWHCCGIGNWQSVARDQLQLLREVGVEKVDATYCGPLHHLDWLRRQAHGLNFNVVRSDPNILHYETFAIQHIEQLAQLDDKPIMYFHTKGVSAPWHLAKWKWRLTMEHYTIRPWRKNLEYLKTYDAVGWNWYQDGEQHFSGNFWMANADYIRKLPVFIDYHRSKKHVRYSCELWIGAFRFCNAKSLGCTTHAAWGDDYDFDQHLNFDVSVKVR